MRLQSAVFSIPDALAGQEDAGKVLSILKMEGVWFYGVTDLARPAAEERLREAELLDDFRGILTAKEAGCALDDAKIYEKAMRRLSSVPRDTVVFTARGDVLRGAKAAGVRVALVRGTQNDADWAELCAQADEIVERYSDFLA